MIRRANLVSRERARELALRLTFEQRCALIVIMLAGDRGIHHDPVVDAVVSSMFRPIVITSMGEDPVRRAAMVNLIASTRVVADHIGRDVAFECMELVKS